MKKAEIVKARQDASPTPIGLPSNLDLDLNDVIGIKARRISKLTSALFAELSEQQEVTALQMGVLIGIGQAGIISVSDLARRLWIDRSTLQELLTRLLKKGIVARRTSAVDRRVHEVWLTEIGIETVQALLPAAKLVQFHVLAGLPDHQISELFGMLDRILERSRD